jgi:hypothetical protein
MTENNASAGDKPPFKLRRCILQSLYSFFKEFPYGSMEVRHMIESCETDTQTLNWNLVYLEKCGYIELDKSPDCPPYVTCTATITAVGIDLVEDEAEFSSKFSIDYDIECPGVLDI